MKTNIMLFLCFLFTTTAIGQFERNNVVKLSPVEFGRAEFKISYERYFANRKHSILVSPTVILKNDDEDKRSGWRMMGQYRYYLSHLNEVNENEVLGLSNIGLYAGFYGLYLDYNDDYFVSYWDPELGEITANNMRNIQSVEGGAIVGIQVDLTKRFVVDLYVGGGVRNSTTENSVDIGDMFYDPDRGGIYPYDYIGVKPTFGFMIGLLF